LKILKGRAELGTLAEKKTRIFTTGASSDSVDAIRGMRISANTAFILERESLPDELARLTTERVCLAATVSDAWFDKSNLSSLVDGDFKFHLVSDCSNAIPAPVFSFGGDALWLDSQKNIDYLKTARKERPILYVGTKQSCLVVHRFNHFSELYALFRKNDSGTKSPGRHPFVQFGAPTEDGGINAKPATSLKRRMIELTS
jgi:hypothetical protein